MYLSYLSEREIIEFDKRNILKSIVISIWICACIICSGYIFIFKSRKDKTQRILDYMYFDMCGSGEIYKVALHEWLQVFCGIFFILDYLWSAR